MILKCDGEPALMAVQEEMQNDVLKAQPSARISCQAGFGRTG